MAANTEDLRNIYLNVAGDAELTEEQEEEPSRDPVGEDESELEEAMTNYARADGLGDAIDGAEMSNDAGSAA